MPAINAGCQKMWHNTEIDVEFAKLEIFDVECMQLFKWMGFDRIEKLVNLSEKQQQMLPFLLQKINYCQFLDL
jgi:hypothetical protein